MANEAVKILVDIAVKGGEKLKGVSSDINALDKTAKTATGGIGGLAKGVAVASGALFAASLAAKQLYGALRQGAQLQTTSQRFDKLSASIGTTADTMIGKLRSATQGMISDMELMSSASQIMSLKLADNEDQVIRLATVAGTLNWDMQQVILTFANMSTMRLDALGLSVEEVKNKAAELEKAGMSAQEAFKEAVILAGEARLDVGGVSESEKAFKQLEAAIANTRAELSGMLIELADASGLIDAMSRSAATMNLRGVFDDLRESGRLTDDQFLELFTTLRYGGPEAAQAALDALGKMKPGLEGVDNALLYNQNAWAAWAIGVQINAAEAARGVAAAATEIFRQITGIDQGLRGLDWAGGYQPSPLATADPNYDNRQRWRVLHAQARARQQDALGPFANIGETTNAIGGYSSAISQATQEELALAEAHSRLLDTFNSEITAKIEDGLIDAAGVVNIENANKALYEQARAAGATAGQLAMLGVATGQFTEEEAKAALKAAILMERIKMLAAGVASGDLGIGDALGSLGAFRDQLDSGQIAEAATSLGELAGAADTFAGEYAATLSVEDTAALAAINDIQLALNNLVSGNYNINVGVTTGGIPALPHEALGGPVGRGRPYVVGEVGPELFIPNTGGSVVSNSQLRDVLSGVSGGSSYNVNITNYIDGQAQPRSAVDDVTTSKLLAALNSLGVR